VLIGPCQQVTAPHTIARHQPRYSVLQLFPRLIDQVVMLPTRVCHIRLAHRHLSSRCPSSIEVMRNGRAAGVRQQRLESDHFVPYPFGLGSAKIARGNRFVR
jgi:hypothetical protein